MSINSTAPFILLSDETNPGVIESYCSICNRLVAASRELNILEIVQRIHMDKKHTPRTMPPT
jgi:hypothetical protein